MTARTVVDVVAAALCSYDETHEDSDGDLADHWYNLSTDDVAALIGEALAAALGDGHYVTFTADRWTVEHSIDCRLSGRMPTCEWHSAIEHATAERPPEPHDLGRWKIVEILGGLPVLTRAPVQEWAQDFDGVWHRMASSEWTKGVGPTAPVACCGRNIDSVSHSTVPPDDLDDGTEKVCIGRP